MSTFTCHIRKMEVTVTGCLLDSSDLEHKSFMPGRITCTGSNEECTKDNCPVLNGEISRGSV